MGVDLYTDDLLWRLPRDALGGPVADLCRGVPDTHAPLVARLIEKWCVELNAPSRTVSALTSANASTFWSTYWEITAARAFQTMELAVDLAPRVGSQTPDMVVTRPGIRSMVEVFAVTPARATARRRRDSPE